MTDARPRVCHRAFYGCKRRERHNSRSTVEMDIVSDLISKEIEITQGTRPTRIWGPEEARRFALRYNVAKARIEEAAKSKAEKEAKTTKMLRFLYALKKANSLMLEGSDEMWLGGGGKRWIGDFRILQRKKNQNSRIKCQFKQTMDAPAWSVFFNPYAFQN